MPPAALVTNDNVPAIVPADWGVNATVIAHEAPAASDGGHALLAE